MSKKLLVCMLLVAFTCSMASAQIITSVDRTRGTAGNRDPIGAFDTDTDPLPTQGFNLIDGNLVFSDRTYPWTATPASMVGNEYVRTFNTDKHSKAIMVNYAVTTSEAAVLWLALDDRIPDEYGTIDGGVQAVLSLEELADLITVNWNSPGLFQDTGMDLFIREAADGSRDRPMSVLATTVEMPAGTYDFKLNPTGKNFYVIGAVPEPMTLSLLGLGGLALVRRKRKM